MENSAQKIMYFRSSTRNILENYLSGGITRLLREANYGILLRAALVGRTEESVRIITEFYVIVDNLMVSGVSWLLVLKVFGLLVVCHGQVSMFLSDFGNRATRVWSGVETNYSIC